MQPMYPLYRASGTARQLGREHGEQAAEAIRAFLDFLAHSLKLSLDSIEKRALVFRPLFERFCPHLVDELAGLAEGAAISPAQALALQLRGELAQVSEGACTTFVIGSRGTASGELLIGQTSDTPAEIERFGCVLHLAPKDRPEVLIWTFGGMLGYHGVNQYGVAHFANALGGGPGWKFSLSHYPLKRLMLECRDLDEVAGLLDRIPVCSNGNYVLCDGSGKFVDVELTSAGPHFIDDAGEGFIAHSNHFLCAPHACHANHELSLPDSFPRLKRMRQLIVEKFGAITVQDVQAFLSDHDGYPVSICRHPHEGVGDPILPSTGKTVAALIAEPMRGRLHVARGNPCTSRFATYQFDAAGVQASACAT